jgi:hypothetical protein
MIVAAVVVVLDIITLQRRNTLCKSFLGMACCIATPCGRPILLLLLILQQLLKMLLQQDIKGTCHGEEVNSFSSIQKCSSLMMIAKKCRKM